MTTQIIDFGFANPRSKGQAERHERRRRGQLTNRQGYEAWRRDPSRPLERVQKQASIEYAVPQFHTAETPSFWPQQHGNADNLPVFRVQPMKNPITSRAYSRAWAAQHSRARRQAENKPTEQTLWTWVRSEQKPTEWAPWTSKSRANWMKGRIEARIRKAKEKTCGGDTVGGEASEDGQACGGTCGGTCGGDTGSGDASKGGGTCRGTCGGNTGSDEASEDDGREDPYFYCFDDY